MTRVIFSRCAVFGSRFSFVKKMLLFSIACLFLTLPLRVSFYIDYSMFVIKIALFRIFLFLSHLDAKIKNRKFFSGFE